MKGCVVAFIFTVSMAFSHAVAAQEPAKETDRNKAVRYTRVLEQRPLDPLAPQMRSWLIGWLQETPDVTVVVCDILGPIPAQEVRFAPELLAQYMAGNGAYQLQNPQSKTDPVKPQLAGLASMLLAYRALVDAVPEARLPVYDEWIAKQEQGLFEREREAAIREHCSTTSTAPPASGTDATRNVAAQPSLPFLGGFLRETRVVYPLKVGDWEAKDEKRYDEPSEGVSVRYASSAETAGWLDVFFYPVGVATAEQVGDIARRERESLILAWLKDSRSKEEDISALRTFPLAMGAQGQAGRESPVTAYSVDLTYMSKDARLNSAMVVLFHQLYMVKLRFSAKEAAHTRTQVRDSLERFASDLLPQLTIVSTGGCWQPLPVHQLAKAATAPEGHLLTVGEGGVGVVYLYPDRILARDPTSPAVAIAMNTGQELQGRLYPGCSGAEPVNPEVQDGMREIRIEYPAPADAPSPADRLGASQRELG